jgi:hypothetical protein
MAVQLLVALMVEAPVVQPVPVEPLETAAKEAALETAAKVVKEVPPA